MSRFQAELATARPVAAYGQLIAAGVTPGRLAGPRWDRPSRGQYRPDGAPASPTQRILDAAAHLPAGGAVGGWAAAYVQGVDWLDGRDPATGRELPVLLCVGSGVHRTRRAGPRWSRAPLVRSEVVEVGGLPVTRGSRIALDGVREVRSVEDALCVLDALAAYRLITTAGLASTLRTYRGRTGIRRLTELAPLVDGRVLSSWETRLRWCWTVQAGLPAPLVNRAVFDLRGNLLGLPDLLDREAGLAVEFDGSDHRGRDQHHRDNHREERFESHGLVVVRVDSLDLRHRSSLVGRLRAARVRALARDPDRDRWTLTPPPWWRG